MPRLQDDFRDAEIVRSLTATIAERAAESGPRTFMEVCGTHTQAIGRWGLRELLPDDVRLVSGPGCPVCVTPGDYLDNACRLALEKNVTLATFGDLIRVPGNETSLEEAMSQGAKVRTVYSPAEAIKLAAETDGEVVFLAVGFETTCAGIAAALKATHARKIENLSFYLSLRLVPPALDALLADPDIKLDGFLLPGHVSAIIGMEPYRRLAAAGTSGVVSGFEPVDILQGVAELLRLAVEGKAEALNLYPRVVRDEGNLVAKKLFDELFATTDQVWRGIGLIPDSGYGLCDELAHLDAKERHGLPDLTHEVPGGCQCGSVLKGIILPPECPLFGKTCTPANPVGPCMVSGEGSCAAYYKYEA